MNHLRTSVFLLTALLLGARSLAAQAPAPAGEVVDRVVAVVGDSVVLKTELDEEVFRMLAASGQSLPDDPAVLDRLYRDALDAKISELLVIQAAERDSLVVADAEVQQRVEQELTRRRQALGSERALVQALRAQGLTLTQYREILTREIRRQAIVERYMASLRDRRPPPVTEEQVRTYFEAQKSALSERPATISFQQVVVVPKPSDEATAAARAEAEQVLQKLHEGEDFEQLAKRHSDDPGSRDRGGSLGWFRRGQMVPEFERVAYALPPGAVSSIVETSFGFHIIKLEKIKGAERQARHILIQPEMTEADVARTGVLAQEVVDKLRAGVPVDSLIEVYGDPALQTAGGPLPSRVGPFPKDRLPAPYVTELASAKDGEIVGPFALQGEGQERWVVARVTEVTEKGEFAWDDPQVRAQARQQLQRQLLMEEVVRELRARTFVDVRL